MATDVALEQPTTTDETDSVVDETCPACAHPMRTHDGLGTRFCAATAANGLDRGCICRPDA